MIQVLNQGGALIVNVHNDFLNLHSRQMIQNAIDHGTPQNGDHGLGLVMRQGHHASAEARSQNHGGGGQGMGGRVCHGCGLAADSVIPRSPQHRPQGFGQGGTGGLGQKDIHIGLQSGQML